MKKGYILTVAALLSALTLSGCAVAKTPENNIEEGEEVEATLPETNSPETNPQEPQQPENQQPETQKPPTNTQTEPKQPVVQPVKKTVDYIKVTADSVNIRSGAGSSYSSVGKAEKNTLYAFLGSSNGWYKTYYKNKVVYIYSDYCSKVEMDKASDSVEKVIAEGTKCLGVTYVYGATRYHDGKGNRLSGFKTSAFDCSSLMQYIFYKGAGVNLQVNTRTQINQGTTVSRSKLKRGDLIFFTNASRKNNTGIERVGHVALYLGNNLILHTASDYAKIEEISSLRWSYYIQTQRMI